MIPTTLLIIGCALALGSVAVGGGSDSAAERPACCGRGLAFWFGLFYLALLAAVGVLGLTGLGTMLTGNSPMSGWTLMLHCSVAPGFAILVTLFALGGASGRSFSGFQYALFWLILLAALVVILSAVIPMTPTFGTPGQHWFYNVHRYASLALFILVALHALGYLFRPKDKA